MDSLVRWLRTAVLTLVTLLLLFEEWGWAALAAAMARLANLPLWARLERRIGRLSPAGALVVFFVPALALLPVKVLALYFMGRGHPLAGAAVLVAAKLAGTAVLARLFTLTQPALMRLAWFARWYPRWIDWKTVWMDRVRRSAPWRTVRRWRARARVRWAALRRRFRQQQR